jgi:hypothetical protein
MRPQKQRNNCHYTARYRQMKSDSTKRHRNKHQQLRRQESTASNLFCRKRNLRFRVCSKTCIARQRPRIYCPIFAYYQTSDAHPSTQAIVQIRESQLPVLQDALHLRTAPSMLKHVAAPARNTLRLRNAGGQNTYTYEAHGQTQHACGTCQVNRTMSHCHLQKPSQQQLRLSPRG